MISTQAEVYMLTWRSKYAVLYLQDVLDGLSNSIQRSLTL